MIYDVSAALVDKDDHSKDTDFLFLVNASNASHLKLLLEKSLPKRAEIFQISVNPSIDQVHIINPKGNKVIKVVTSNPNNACATKGCELINECDYPTFTELYCIANSINEVLDKVTELGYEGNLIEISIFTADVTYLY